jgi:hypothetical protein
MKIVFGNDVSKVAEALNTLPTLSERRNQLARQFFTGIMATSSCLHYLLPNRRDQNVTSKLRNAKEYIPPFARTERYRKSTIVYALNNYL